MYSTFELALKYVSYYLKASNGRGHGMHSPFVFDFILHVLNNKKAYHPPAVIEQLRNTYRTDNSYIDMVEMGAGSRTGNAGKKKVSAVAASALKNKKYAQMLFRLVKHYQPATILELGTSLGITTAYMASAHPSARLITVEGNPYIREKALNGFRNLSLDNIESVEGNFDEVLPGILASTSCIDLAYVDGNHKKKPTIDYFAQILKRTGDHSIMVFDDIHWSSEMEEAWNEIKEHPSVMYTIDIFYLGFVFFRKDFKTKQNFCIRF